MKYIYKNVKIGENARIEECVFIGCPPCGKTEGELETVIGDDCVIRSGTVIYAGNIIGKNFQTGHNVVIREENRIGDDVSIGTLSCIEHHVEIQNKVRMHSQVFVPEYSVLEERCWIGPKVTMTNTFHPQCPGAKKCMKGPRIRKEAKIGANTTILPDITIGEGAFIGAGSVVTKNIPEKKVACGNPARIGKYIHDLSCKYDLMDAPYGKNTKK